MAQSKIKSSLYLSPRLHQQAKILSEETSLSLNTVFVLALQEYLQREDRQQIIQREASN